MKKQQAYGNDSISALKGADRVRKRPAVIFGSDGLDGCEHAVFEILSNAIDEAREGHGDLVIVTRYEDHSIEITSNVPSSSKKKLRSKGEKQQEIARLTRQMKEAAKMLEFEIAAQLRDQIKALENG